VKRWSRRTVDALLFIASYVHSALGMPSFNQVKADFQPSDTLILDRHGEILISAEKISIDSTAINA
jgi:hypothetical protein